METIRKQFKKHEYHLISVGFFLSVIIWMRIIIVVQVVNNLFRRYLWLFDWKVSYQAN